MLKKIIGSFVFTTVLFLSYFIINPVYAEDVSDIASEEEFYTYLDTYKTKGGKARLTSDIHMTQSYEYATVPAFRLKKLEIDTNGHTIYIENTVKFEYVNQHLIFVSSGDQPVFNITPTHSLYLSMCDIQSSNAILQQEGSLLYAPLAEDDPNFGNTITGTIQYASAPVIVGPEEPTYQVLRSGDDISGLPDKQRISINWHGKMLSYYQGEPYYAPITWDRNTKLQDNVFTKLSGSYHGSFITEDPALQRFQCERLTVVNPPYAQVISTKEGIAIKDIYASTSFYGTTITMTTLYQEEPDTASLMIRFPDEDWKYARDVFDQLYVEEGPDMTVLFLPEDIPIEFDLTLEFRYGDEIRYSNMAVLLGDVIQMEDFEGTRGGNAPIIPPDDPEPDPEPLPTPLPTPTPEPNPEPDVKPDFPGQDDNMILPTPTPLPVPNPIEDIIYNEEGKEEERIDHKKEGKPYGSITLPHKEAVVPTVQDNKQPAKPYVSADSSSTYLASDSDTSSGTSSHKQSPQSRDTVTKVKPKPTSTSSHSKTVEPYMILIVLFIILSVPVFLLLKKFEASR